MASVDKRPTGSWRARWREYPGGPQKTKHFNRKVDAERFLTEVRADLQRGTYVDPAAGLMTFKAYAEQWRTVQAHRPNTERLVEQSLRLYLYPALGSRPIANIRQSDVRGTVKLLSGQLAPSTVRTVYRHLSAIMTSAVADRIIAVSPCQGVKLPTVERRPVEIPTLEQVEAITGAIDKRYLALVTFTAGTGLRASEAFAVTVDRVDFLRRTVQVDRQVDVEGEFAPLKTSASYRTVPLPQVVVEALAVHLAQWPAGESGLIFTTPQGHPLSVSALWPAWNAARTSSKVNGLKFHGLRHFYASLLIRHGESVKVVQARLGHASARETIDTYTHLWPDSEDRTREAIDSVLGRAEDLLRTEASGE